MLHPVLLEWHEHGPLQFLLIDLSLQREVDLDGAPLLKRAWVLQEQLLAPRSIIYGKSQVYWICDTLEASEMFPGGSPDLREGDALLQRTLKPRPLQCLKGMIACEGLMWFSHPTYNKTAYVSYYESFWLSWRSIVLDYTKRNLTFTKDKLAAIAGLASMIESKIDVRYIAGMWKVRHYLEQELCWRPGRPAYCPRPFRPREYRAPTWSWASIEGDITYEYIDSHDYEGDYRLATVEDVSIETLDGTTTGPIKTASMQIEGPLIPDPVGDFSPDDLAQDWPHMIYHLAMFRLQLDRHVWGLALRRLDSGPFEGCYERVAIFDIYDDGEDGNGGLYDTYCETPKKSITLI